MWRNAAGGKEGRPGQGCEQVHDGVGVQGGAPCGGSAAGWQWERVSGWILWRL